MTYNREVFTSFADDLGVIHLTADADRALNFSFGMNRPEHYKVTADGNDLLMQGQLPDGVDTLEMKGLRYASRVRVILPKGGNVTPGDSTVSVRNASEAILLVSMATDYFDKDLAGKVSSLLANAEKKDFASLKKRAYCCLPFPVRPCGTGFGTFFPRKLAYGRAFGCFPRKSGRSFVGCALFPVRPLSADLVHACGLAASQSTGALV